MMNITQDIHTKLACEFCSHEEVEIYTKERTSYHIIFHCGMCGHKNNFIHVSGDIPQDSNVDMKK